MRVIILDYKDDVLTSGVSLNSEGIKIGSGDGKFAIKLDSFTRKISGGKEVDFYPESIGRVLTADQESKIQIKIKEGDSSFRVRFKIYDPIGMLIYNDSIKDDGGNPECM